MKKKLLSIGLAVGLITLLGATALAGDYFVKPPELSTYSLEEIEILEMQKAKILEQNPDWYEGKQWVETFADGSTMNLTLDEWLQPYELYEGDIRNYIILPSMMFEVTNQDDIDELNRYAEESVKLQQEQELALELENQD